MTEPTASPPRYVSYARRLHDLASADPDRVALTVGEQSLTRRELHHASTRLARELAALGTVKGDMVTVALPNSLEWFVAFAAAWKLGATPQPVSARLPARELEAIVELADSRVVVGADPSALAHRTCVTRAHVTATIERRDEPEPLDDIVSDAWKAPTSGGSTGRPKLIVSGDPSLLDLEVGPSLLIEPDGCMVMPGPLYHNGPLIWSCLALLWGDHVVVLERFDAEATLAAIDTHGADIIYLVPTMMKRISRLPDDVRDRYDLSSLRVVWHLAEPCPDWLKQTWIDWLGPERIVELYGGTEGQLSTVITGTEWLAHRGSVGRPLGGQVRICDDDGNELPAGEQGEVWLRTARTKPSYRYVGAEPRTMEGGWESLGDVGWLDEDGYLYLGDRKQDMILTGGVNVYPAEVESALQEHPAVHSCAVIGLPDEDRGNVVHAIVEADVDAVTEDELRAFLEERLVRYKIPRSFEFVDEPLRDDAGKVRRSALRAGRVPEQQQGA
jgi:bile acid-coenzyme A ligase